MGGGTPHDFAYENIGIWDAMCQNTCVFTHFLKVDLKLIKIIDFGYKIKNPY